MIVDRTKIKFAVVLVLLHCVLPLITGAVLYAVYRPGAIGMPILFTPLSASAGVAYILCYHAPDGLWAYSFASALFILHQASYSFISLRYRIVVLVLLCFFECVQWWLPHRFTFDVWDLAATAAGCISAVAAIKNTK